MLRSFRVENHKSIKDEAELLLMPAYDKSRPVVPVAAIFGANASGKSNLLDALAWMRTAVLTSFANWQPGSGVPRTPFRLTDKIGASVFVVEVVVDELRYTYGFEVDDETVREEWLYAYPHQRRRVIFERDSEGIRFGSTVPDYRSRGEQLARMTRENALFLTVAALNDVAEVGPVYQWFRKSLVVADAQDTSVDVGLVRELLASDRNVVLPLIRAADLGITDVSIDDVPSGLPITANKLNELVDKGVLKPRPSGRWYLAGERVDPSVIADIVKAFPRLRFRHGTSTATLGIDEQSAGTLSWIRLISQALGALEAGSFMIVDEVGASLHPHLTARFINLFRDAQTNTRHAQLLFTTHDATLLDDESLARDEIWFVEKDAEAGTTRLFPLTDFHPRRNENTEGRYLAGSYGAVPVVSDYAIREALRDRQDNNALA